MRYISDLKEGEQVVEHYLCTTKQVLKTRAGKTYYSLRLQDKTGTVDAKIWDLNDGISNFEAHDYIKINAMVIMFQNAIQLNVRRLRKSDEGEYDPKEYIKTSDYDIEEMYRELLDYIEKVKEPYLNKLLKAFFVEDEDFIRKFKYHTAAKTMHHNFMGGLLEHTLSVVRICEFLAKQYPIINKDVLFTSAICHDIGKIKELSSFPIIEYTDEGQLMGHIVIGIEWVTEKIRQIKGFPEKLANLIKHCVAAHHGELEYGSPKKPQIIEALALTYADNTDAKLRSFSQIVQDSDQEADWAGYQKIFESNIRKTRY